MKAKELHQKKDEELKATLGDLKKAQMNLRFKKSAQALDNPSEVKKTRRAIARVKTILHSRAGKE